MSTNKNTPPLLTLSDEDMDELGNFLLSDATSDETMMLDCLDGFLTAIVTAPVMLSPGVWLPKVWGSSDKDEPAFDNYAQVERITSLIMRHLSNLVVSLQQNPDACEPIFDSAVYPDSPREFVDGEMWAYGFMTAINLQRQDWQAVFDDPNNAELLRPIYLLGTEDVTPSEEALIETPEQREELSKQIPASVAGLYRFWSPVRRAVTDPAIRREMPTVGRNEKCPCGSGRKFKKCCGATTVLE
ncbi:MAG: UPF0149 family protein [Gallionella sp.]|nr:UPF0149 family protein [Gallionella sp.]